ncbi:MAG: DUF4271 domain-containing protein [Bacteroidales bacterium]|nr:DUF4271 domain-containing protein [Bacteroidales bacterium]
MPEVFRQGVLEMSGTPLSLPAGMPSWQDCLTNRIAVVVTVLLGFCLLREYQRLVPALRDCLIRWKANVSLEHSMSQARSRNLLALSSALPFLLLADRFRFFRPAFWDAVPLPWSLPATAGVLLVFVLFRGLLYLLIRPARLGTEQRTAARKTLYNCFILLVLALLLTTMFLLGFHAGDTLVRRVLLGECALFWLVSLVRTGQIFAANCNSFATILYLCAFEILPFGILLFTGTL